MFVLVTGLPASGKTTLALALAEKLGAIHLNTDVVRRELDLMGQYDPESKARVYKTLEEKLEQWLQQKRDVVVDATLYRESLRRPFFEIGARHGYVPSLIEIRASEAAIHERMQQKRLYSEADMSVYNKLKPLYEPISRFHLVLYSDRQSLEQMVEHAHAFIQLQQAL